MFVGFEKQVEQIKQPAIATMQGPHSLVQCGNKARPFQSVSDPFGKPHMIHRQTLYYSVVLRMDTGVIRLMVTNETLYDSVVLTKDN